MKKYLWMLSAAVVVSALKVKMLLQIIAELKNGISSLCGYLGNDFLP